MLLTSIDEIAEGGRGLKLMWQIADEVSYTRTANDRNCLLLSKNFKSESLAAGQTIKEASALNDLMNVLNRWDWLDETDHQEELAGGIIEKISLEINSDVKALSEVLKWFDRLKYLSIPNEVWLMCQLALAEGFMNAVRHAHKYLPPETPVKLEVKVLKGRLEIRIWDCGKPFDFQAKLNEILDVERKKYEYREDLSAASVLQKVPKNLSEPCLLIAG